MRFTDPWALWALLAVPVVVLLHLFRRRLQQRNVAGLFLFLGQDPVPPEGAHRDRLRWTWPLVLECLAAALLALWLAGPVLSGGQMGQHLVVVLDDSASMGARTQGESPGAQALGYLRARAEELGSAGRLTVIFAGAEARVALGPEAPVALVEDVRPTFAAVVGNLGAALTLAEALGATGDGGETEFLLLTDEAMAAGVAPGWAVHAFGRPAANVALQDVQRVGDDVRVAVQGFVSDGGARDIEVEVEVTAPVDGEVLGRSRIPLRERPGRSSGQQLAPLRGAATLSLSRQVGDDLRVAITGGGGALARDDDALLLPESVRQVTLGLRGESSFSAAMRWPRLRVAVPGTTTGDDPHVIVIDGSASRDPDSRAPEAQSADLPAWGAPCVLIVAPTEGAMEPVRGPFLADRSHAVLDGVPLEGVVWSGGAAAPQGRPLLSAGDQVLLSVEESFDTLVVRANLDLGASTVCDHPAWPALWSNLVELARARLPGALQANVRSGEAMRWRTSPDARGAEFVLKNPLGQRLPPTGVRTLEWMAVHPGLHVLYRDGVEVGRFAVHFHAPGESDLTDRGTVSRAAVPRSPEDAAARAAAERGAAPRTGRWERMVLAAVLLLIAGTNWWLLARGRA